MESKAKLDRQRDGGIDEGKGKDDADGGGGCSRMDGKGEKERKRDKIAFLGNEDGHHGNCS